MALYAIIRIRGQADVHPKVESTLKLLRLHKKFHCVLYPDSLPGIKGMVPEKSSLTAATMAEVDR